MWGLDWGQMIWGRSASVAVPALGFWGTLLLGAVLGAVGVRRLRGRARMAGAAALALALLLPISARALPFTFTNGTVADATQVNANFAALASAQSLGPSASSSIVDLTTSLGNTCASGGGIRIDDRVGPDAIGGQFVIQSGQTLVVTSVNVSFSTSATNAGHTLSIFVYRMSATQSNPIDFEELTLDARGAGTTKLTYPTGSIFGPGTFLCITAEDLTTFTSPLAGASAHGFLTTQ
jgi:hypothetical protein